MGDAGTAALRKRDRLFGIGLPRASSSVALLSTAALAGAQLPPVPERPENPTTAEKALLGKALFWDEQLSSDGTVACGTCHRPARGGGDPRTTRTAGPDGVLNTDDDVHGTQGVIFADAAHIYQRSSFGFDVKVTGRLSPGFIGAQYFTEQFWEGRAPSEFVDPQTGSVSIASGVSLESQSVGPPLSTVEMAHAGRDWAKITKKLERAVPLKRSPQLSADLAAALSGGATYLDLFAAAFSDGPITGERIAFAIAAYERTLVPDETPRDKLNQGDSTALTSKQQRGLALFSDDAFHNIGVRPSDEDVGREAVTGDWADRGRFKTPSLRNARVRGRLTHRGSIDDIPVIVSFYNLGGDFFDNLDPLIVPLGLTSGEKGDLSDFVKNGLVDARVEAETAPFDRPLLHSEVTPPKPEVFGVDSGGSGGFVPRMLAVSPPSLGNDAWALGTTSGLGGAAALLVSAPDPANPGDDFGGVPLNIALTPPLIFFSFVLSGAGDGDALVGQEWFAQWFMVDPAAVGGFAASKGARFTFF
jgi:cytochrome c peroxidase